MAVEAQQYKDVLSKWSTGVTIATTIYAGKWKGITVSSFTSVSLNPPLILICLANTLYSCELISKSGVFCINILSSDQIELGKLFAGLYPEIEDRFAGLNVRTGITGSPILPGTLGWVECETRAVHPGGDHTIFVGEVVSTGVNNGTSPPLMYHNRKWGTFSAFDG